MNMTKSRKKIYQLVIVGLMAALVFAGNYLQIKIPNGVLITRIHFGNSMCLLAGLLFGSMKGGLASGFGAALFDLFDPVYIVSSPYTFISKFAMGFTAGKIRTSSKSEKEMPAVLGGAIVGQLVYIVLYLIKSYFTIIIIGGTTEAAWTAVGTNAITSSVNAVIAVAVSVPLYFALRKALSRTEIFTFIKNADVKEEKTERTSPAIYALTAFAIIVTIIFSINLSASKKLEAAQAEKEASYQQQIDDLNTQVEANTKAIEDLEAKLAG